MTGMAVVGEPVVSIAWGEAVGIGFRGVFNVLERAGI
jgi:hypothetical protein